MPVSHEGTRLTLQSLAFNPSWERRHGANSEVAPEPPEVGAIVRYQRGAQTGALSGQQRIVPERSALGDSLTAKFGDSRRGTCPIVRGRCGNHSARTQRLHHSGVPRCVSDPDQHLRHDDRTHEERPVAFEERLETLSGSWVVGRRHIDIRVGQVDGGR
jgi:hypothetical protein